MWQPSGTIQKVKVGLGSADLYVLGLFDRVDELLGPVVADLVEFECILEGDAIFIDASYKRYVLSDALAGRDDAQVDHLEPVPVVPRVGWIVSDLAVIL